MYFYRHIILISLFFIISISTSLWANEIPVCDDNFWNLYANHVSPSVYHTLDDCIADPACTTFLVEGHRGSMLYAPENSIAAFDLAVKSGLDSIEIDVRTTKDGYLILMHDDTVDRTSNGKGKVSDMTLAEIKALKLKSHYPCIEDQEIPTLKEALDFLKGKITIDLDVKSANPENLINEIRESEMFAQVMLLTKNLETGRKYRELEPQARLIMRAKSPEDVSLYLEELAPTVLEVDLNFLSAKLVDEVHQRGAKLIFYASAYIDILGKIGYNLVYQMGIDILKTDRPFAAVQFAHNKR